MATNGIIQAGLCWLLGDNWKTSITGLVSGFFKIVAALAFLPANLIPARILPYWQLVVAIALALSGAATMVGGRFQKDAG